MGRHMAATQRLSRRDSRETWAASPARRSTGCTAASGSSPSRSSCTRAGRARSRGSTHPTRSSSARRSATARRCCTSSRWPTVPTRAIGKAVALLRAAVRRPGDRPRLEGGPVRHRHRGAGAWQRGDPVASTWQLGSVGSGRYVLVTGLGRGVDVDGGRTTVRSRFVPLPAGREATLRLRYWTGLSSAARTTPTVPGPGHRWDAGGRAPCSTRSSAAATARRTRPTGTTCACRCRRPRRASESRCC